MIVKILSSAGSFSGVEYNENKVSTGSAQLLAAENFGLLELDGSATGKTIYEYQQFFKGWSLSEKGRIEKPQFHAVISCEGREFNADQLKAIAEQYLEKMGYINNPYLIYFHSDTANNHVHVVSSRVGENGLKINDSFEYRRSQTAIKEILGLDAGREVADQVKKALAYNFSSEAQFKMILESKGIVVKGKEGDYQFIKSGNVAHKMAMSQVDNKIKIYQEPKERISQLKALFIKYKPALTPDKFTEFMKAKFGVELIFHQAKDKDTPYGYSILDHSKGQVLKGAQVMPLAALLALAPREDMLKAGGELITSLAENEKLRYREFKNDLTKLGFNLSPTGQVKLNGEEKVSFAISKDRIKQLMYQDRLFEAHKFNVNTPVESEIIGRVMGLQKQDFPPEQRLEQSRLERERHIISDKLNSLLSTGKDLGDIAKENNYAFAKKENDVYLINKQNHTLYKMANLTNRNPDYSSVNIIDADRANRPENTRQMEYSSGTFAEVTNTLLGILQDIPEGEKQEQKRKRKRND